MTKLIVGYVRVSVEEKSCENSTSINNQITLIENYALSLNKKIDKFYVDDGATGMNYMREGFIKLKEDIIKGNIDTVIVKDISRLGREAFDSAFFINEFFPYYNVRLISITDCLDNYDNAFKEIYINIKSVVNANYVKDISLKRKATALVKTNNFEYIGVYPPYGYKIIYKEKKRSLEIDSSLVSFVKKIFFDFANCRSLQEIANYMTLKKILTPRSIIFNDDDCNWTPSMVRNILKNKVYIGSFVVRKSVKIGDKRKSIPYAASEVIPNKFPAIIHEDLFVKCNMRFLKYNKKNDGKQKSPYLVYCNNCSKKLCLHVRTRSKREFYYRCFSCKSKYYFLSKIDELMQDLFNNQLKDLDLECFLKNALYYIKDYLETIVNKLNKSNDQLTQNIKKKYISKLNGSISTDAFLITKKRIDANIKTNTLKIEALNDYTNKIDINKLYKDFILKLDFKKVLVEEMRLDKLILYIYLKQKRT